MNAAAPDQPPSDGAVRPAPSPLLSSPVAPNDVATADLAEKLSDVSATSVLTLWARAQGSRSPRPLLPDPAAEALVEQLRPAIARLDAPIYRPLPANDLPKMLVLYLTLRARRFDAYARDFVHRFGSRSTVVVNLGCGLDTRFARLDDGHIRVVELDLPPVIDLKRSLLPAHPRHTLLAGSVLDHAWMDALDRYDNARFIFLAEGLFMYLPEAEVKQLVLALAARFPGSELVAEVFSSWWLRPPLDALVARKLRRQFQFGDEAMFRFGIENSRSLEAWSPRLELVDDWSFLDERVRALAPFRWLRHVRAIRQIQWVIHYRLG